MSLPINSSWTRFFSRWFYISIILILMGLITSDMSACLKASVKLSFLLHTFSLLLQSAGVAILVANIFTFILGTKEFIEFIQQKLIDIIVSREFMSKLNQDERRNILKAILRPGKTLSEIYSGIVCYFDKYIDDSLKLFNYLYRSNVVFTAHAKMDNVKNLIRIDESLNYRVYKIDNKFEKLTCAFEDSHSEHLETRLFAPDGTIQMLTNDSIESINDNSIPTKSYIHRVPDTFNNFSYIDINRKFVEYGYDHWAVFSFKILQPSDKLLMDLYCDDGITIKYYNTYGIQKNFHIEKSEDRIRISYNDWLSPGCGVSVILCKHCSPS